MSSHVITLKQDTEHHRCALPGEPWDIVPKFIEGGILVDLRRKLKRSTMIDKRHPLTKSYAPSLNRLKEAEKSHLVEHYYMIHPFSMFSFYFNMLVVVILIMHFIAAPVVYPLLESNWIINVILLPVNLVFISLIIITFSTGCYDETHNVVIMKTGYVAARYLRTYFIFDILSFLPQILRFSRMDEALQRKSFHMTTPILVILRYFRYFWCLKVLQNLRLYYGFSTFTYKAVKLILHITVGLVLCIYISFSFLASALIQLIQL
uniref:Ion transport domain-containing protein n=1 Tax=Dendroctonus ponderosae TaxID=77166 RepID=A0AAR5PDA2_DENPD